MRGFDAERLAEVALRVGVDEQGPQAELREGDAEVGDRSGPRAAALLVGEREHGARRDGRHADEGAGEHGLRQAGSQE